MNALILACLAVLLWALPAQAATTRYVTSTARGATAGAPCTAISRCTVAAAISQSSAGDTISLEANTDITAPYLYRGASDMIAPPSGKDGTSSAFINIVAETEGGVTIDGQHARVPVQFSNNSFWNVTGINACCSSIETLYINNGSTDINVYRSVFWDATIDQNTAVIGIHSANTTRILLEDVAAFGTGRKLLQPSQSGGGNIAFTCRRCYLRFGGSTYTTGLTTLAYANSGITFENLLATYDAESMPQTYTSTAYPASGTQTNYNVAAPMFQDLITNGVTGTANTNVNFKLYGSILYGRASPTHQFSTTSGFQGIFFPHDGVFGITVRDSIFAWHPSNPIFGAINGVHSSGAVNNNTVTFTNVTTLGGVASTYGGSQTQTNVVNSTSSGLTGGIPTVFTGTSNPWTGSTGAQICYRTVAGVVSNIPLWPWPMEARIAAATAQAGKFAGACTTNCTTGGVSWMTGSTPNLTPRPSRTQVNVTTEIEAMFGTIPAACREQTSQNFPDATGFPSTAVLSTFSSAGTPPVSFATVTGNSFTEAAGVATPTNGFSTIRWNTPFGPDQEVYATLATPPTVGTANFYVAARMEDASNRYRAYVTAVTGTNNDTVTLEKVAGGVTTILDSADLGVDIAAGDALGMKVVSDAITVTYNSAGSWAEWREVLSGTAATTPASSYIGMSAGTPVTVTSFGGGGDAVGGDSTAPSTPTNCTVTALSQTSLLVSCDASTDNVGVVSYSEKQCSGAACTPTQIIRDTAATTFTVTGLTANTLYRFSRRAYDGTNFSSESSVYEGTTLSGADTTPPSAPTNLHVARTVGDRNTRTDARLIWTEATDAVGVALNRIERGDGSCANFSEIIVIGAVATVDDFDVNIPINEARCYRIRAEDLAGNVGDYSSSVILYPVSGGAVR